MLIQQQIKTFSEISISRRDFTLTDYKHYPQHISSPSGQFPSTSTSTCTLHGTKPQIEINGLSQTITDPLHYSRRSQTLLQHDRSLVVELFNSNCCCWVSNGSKYAYTDRPMTWLYPQTLIVYNTEVYLEHYSISAMEYVIWMLKERGYV